DDRPQGPGRAATAADDLTEVVGVNAHLKHAPAAEATAAHLDVVGVLDYALDQMLQGFLEHVRLRCLPPRPPPPRLQPQHWRQQSPPRPHSRQPLATQRPPSSPWLVPSPPSPRPPPCRPWPLPPSRRRPCPLASPWRRSRPATPLPPPRTL